MMRERQLAIEAARTAGQIIRNDFGKISTVRAKGGNPKDLVTNVDQAAERAIIELITKQFPDDGINSEETGQHQAAAARVWVIDPLDGTTNYTRLIPTSCTSIALLVKATPVLGVVYLPFTDELYVAEQGKGAHRNDLPIHVSATKELRQAFASVEWYSRSVEFQAAGIASFTEFARQTSKIRYLSNTIFEIVRVASGEFDFQICDTHYLDTAAAGLILHEAGGQLTDQLGRPLDPTNNGVIKIVSSNRTLHHQVLALVRPN